MIKAAVIGAGHMGSNHVRVYAGMEAVKLVAVADGLVAMELAQKLIESGRRHMAIQCCRKGSEYAEIGRQKRAGDRWSRVYR
jgi:predicted homoserine dehydrogenase-like protein